MTKPNPPYLRALAWTLVLVVAAGVALAGTARPAAAATSAASASQFACWKRLLNDWYDGRIDHAYPVRCYREAITNLPQDIKVYADAEADIRRALLAAIRQSTKTTGKTPTETTPVRPPAKPKPAEQPAPSDPETNENEVAGLPPSGGDDPSDPLAGDTLPTGATRSAESVPLPLIVLGALAMLLLAAAGAGVVSKRLQARRIPATPPPREDPPPVS